MAFLIYLYHLIIEGDDISMRKDITIEKLILGGEKWISQNYQDSMDAVGEL